MAEPAPELEPDDQDELHLANEEALIGALLIHPANVELLPSLSVEDLARPLHRILLTAIRESVERAEDPLLVDQLVVFDQLRRMHTDSALPSTYLDAPRMFDLAERCPSPSNFLWYASKVREVARMRHLREVAVRLRQMSNMADVDLMMEAATQAWLELGLIIDPTADADTALVGLSSWESLVDDNVRRQYDWVIPGLLERQDRVIWVAAEGVGKSVLARQVALMTASGHHPFQPFQEIEPQRTLVIDLENPPSLVARQGRFVVEQLRHRGWWLDDMAHVWLHPDGLNIRKPDDARLLERVIADRRPRLVTVGPLRKLAGTARSGESYEYMAEEVTHILDRLRVKYGFALWIEHHAPKAQGGRERDLDPLGSGVWISWPEFGKTLRMEYAPKAEGGKPTGRLKVDQFRNDRDEGRGWPTMLRRGGPGEFPWVAEWTDEDLADMESWDLK